MDVDSGGRAGLSVATGVGIGLLDDGVAVIENNVVSKRGATGIAIRAATALRLHRNRVTGAGGPGFVIGPGPRVLEMAGNAADSNRGPRFMLRPAGRLSPAMGTFHSDKGELHGITVVVVTTGPRVYVGRYDEATSEGVLLLDADHHDEDGDGKSNEDYLRRAVKYGVFKKHDRILVPADRISSVHRLGTLRVD